MSTPPPPASPTWGLDEPVYHGPPPGPMGWLRAGVRAVPLAGLLGGGLGLLLLLRLVERPLFGLRRPWTPWITQGVCRAALWLLGIGYETRGGALRGPGAIVANHASWLDIFTLNAGGRVYFVSKAEVAGWPGIGWLARATGTVFIRRDRRDARAQTETFAARLAAGHRLLFFPEGTSTDGLRVLPFKPTLFAAFLSEPLRADMRVQPVSLRYEAPPGADPRFYGWWGDMSFGESVLRVLAQSPQGRVVVTRHPPLRVADHADRKALARAAETAVRAGCTGA